MIPLVDTHCHLLAGLDDGPRTVDDALVMCRMAWEEGTRVVAATAHLGEQWPNVTPDRIRRATLELEAELTAAQLPLTVYPTAEVAIRPELDQLWQRGELLGVSGRNRYLLIEMPAGQLVDIHRLVCQLDALGVRLVLAHAERYPELLYDRGAVDELVRIGCVIQVSSDSITEPLRRGDTQILKRWIRRGLVHLIASDGHSRDRRPPRMAAAYRRIVRWAGENVANRLCSINGLIVLEGLPLRAPPPELRRKHWFSRSIAAGPRTHS
jgi:protein-tyrosine phosphatase